MLISEKLLDEFIQVFKFFFPDHEIDRYTLKIQNTYEYKYTNIQIHHMHNIYLRHNIYVLYYDVLVYIDRQYIIVFQHEFCFATIHKV